MSILFYLSSKAGNLAGDRHLYAMLSGYLFIAPYFFFAVLNTAHRAMKTAKENLLHTTSEQFQNTYLEIQEGLTSKHGDMQTKIENIEQLQRLHKLTQSFNTWPFEVRSIRKFVVTTLAPLASTAAAFFIEKVLT